MASPLFRIRKPRGGFEHSPKISHRLDAIYRGFVIITASSYYGIEHITHILMVPPVPRTFRIGDTPRMVVEVLQR